MKKELLLIGIIITTVFASSCSSTYYVSIQPELENLFVGKTYAEIIDVLGAPDRLTPDGRGGQIMVFENIETSTNGYVNSRTNYISLFSSSSKGYTHMYVNSENVCYQVRTNREKEKSKFSPGKTISLIAAIAMGTATAIIMKTRLEN